MNQCSVTAVVNSAVYQAQLNAGLRESLNDKAALKRANRVAAGTLAGLIAEHGEIAELVEIPATQNDLFTQRAILRAQERNIKLMKAAIAKARLNG